jgi:hypothetical protein
VRELGGEKIDIIRYFADPKEMIIEALKPAVPREIIINEKDHRILLRVATDDLAVAIGRKGQNARLTSRLIGWRLDIEEFKAMGDNPRQTAIDSLVKTFAMDEAIAEPPGRHGHQFPGGVPRRGSRGLGRCRLHFRGRGRHHGPRQPATRNLTPTAHDCMSIRIHKLAEELGLDNKEMMALLKERKIIAPDVKSVSSTVDNINAAVLREEFAAKQEPVTAPAAPVS